MGKVYSHESGIYASLFILNRLISTLAEKGLITEAEGIQILQEAMDAKPEAEVAIKSIWPIMREEGYSDD